MDLAIERKLKDAGWEMEKLAALQRGWDNVYHLRSVDGGLMFVAHEAADGQHGKMYAVYGKRVDGPFKHIGGLCLAQGQMLYAAMDQYDIMGIRWGDRYYNGRYDPCGSFAVHEDEPLFPAITAGENYALMHGQRIVAHERYMIWGHRFVGGKKFYLTGKAKAYADGGEYQAVWGDDRSCWYEAVGHAHERDGVPIFGGMRRGYAFDVRGVNDTYAPQGFLAALSESEEARIVRANGHESVVWRGRRGKEYERVEQESVKIQHGSLSYWAVDTLDLEHAVVDNGDYPVPEDVLRHSEELQVAAGKPLYFGSRTVTDARHGTVSQPVVVYGAEILPRPMDAYDLRADGGRITCLAVMGRHIVRLSRPV